MKRTATETKAIRAYIASIRENVTSRLNTAEFIEASHAIADMLEIYLKDKPTLSVGEIREKIAGLESEIVESYGSMGVMNYVLTFLEGLDMARNWPFKD